MARVLLQHRLRGLSGPLFQKFGNKLVHTVGNYIAGAGGLPDLPWPEDTNFIGAFRGETDVQNVNVDGEICNLMPLGTITATSTHNAPILAPDYDGVYREYGIDEPVWKGNRWDAGVSYSTDVDGGPLKPTPFLQANEAGTNLVASSQCLTPTWLHQTIIVTPNYGIGLNGEQNTTLGDDNTAQNASLQLNNVTTTGAHAGRVYFRKQTTAFTHNIQFNIFPLNKKIQVDPTNGDFLDRDPAVAYNFAIVDEGDWFLLVWDAPTGSTSTAIDIYIAVNNVQPPNGSVGSGIGTTEIGYVDIVDGYDYESIQSLPLIYTSGAAASIPATEYTFPAANIDPVEDTRIVFRFENTGADGPILDIGKNLELGMLSNELILTDGTNTVTLPIAKGTHDINIIVSGHEMAIKAGAAYAVGAYTSVPAGVITVNRNIWALHTLPALDLERVLNGDFEDGDTGWTGVSVTNGQATTVSTTGYQVIHTTAGIDYEVNFQCDAKGVSPQLQIQNGNVTGSPVIAEVNPSGNGVMQPYSTTFTALGPDSIVILSNGSNTALWDNISIKAI